MKKFKKINKQKKAQVWYADFSIGLLIFIVAISGYMVYSYSETVEEKGELTELLIDAKVIASSLVSEGYPSNWTSTNVTRIGLTDGNQRIVQQKLEDFNDFSYSERGDLLGTTKDYYFYLEYLNGTTFNQLGLNGTNADKLVQVTRVLIYNDTFVKMTFYLWQP